jgi:hypothetical protein
MCKWSYKMLVSQTSSMILVFSTLKQNLSSQFLNFDIENPLGGGTLAKIESSLYCITLVTVRTRSKQNQLWLTVAKRFQRVRSWGLASVIKRSKSNLVRKRAAYFDD